MVIHFVFEPYDLNTKIAFSLFEDRRPNNLKKSWLKDTMLPGVPRWNI